MITKELTEIRCEKCDKKLGNLKGEIEIKCPRCKHLNYVNNNF